MLGLSFGMSRPSAGKYAGRLKPCLKSALKAEGVAPARLFRNQADFDKALDGVQEIIVDATEMPTQRPEDKEGQKERYSGKKSAAPSRLR